MSYNIMIRCITLFLSVLFLNQIYAQLIWSPNQQIIFLNSNADTLNHALNGGMNQAQFLELDINNDSKIDLLIYDRTGGKYLPYINNGKLGIQNYDYAPQYEGIFPYVQNLWVKFADFDGDAKPDLWTKINNKLVIYRNITTTSDPHVKFILAKESVNAYNYGNFPLDSSNVTSDNFNIPVITDMDNDGDVDFITYQILEGNVLYYRNICSDYGLPKSNLTYQSGDLCWGYFKDTSYTDLELNKSCYKKYYKKHAAGSMLMAYDQEGDGDVDMLLGNSGGKNMIYLENGKTKNPSNRDTIINYQSNWPSISTTAVNKNNFPAGFYLDADGDGIKDIIVAPNQYEEVYPIDYKNQIDFYKNIGSNTNHNFKLEKQGFFTDKMVDFGSYTSPNLTDIDADGDLDLLIVAIENFESTKSTFSKIKLMRNIGNRNNPVFKLEHENIWNLAKDSIKWASIDFGDLDKDGLKDMVVGHNNGQIYYYKNTGSATNWTFAEPIKNFLDIDVGESATPQLIDYDKDGHLDLFIGNRAGYINHYKNLNKPSITFTLITDSFGRIRTNDWRNDFSVPGFSFSGNSNPKLIDYNGDGSFEVLSGSEGGKVKFFRPAATQGTGYWQDSSVFVNPNNPANMHYSRFFDYGNMAHIAVGDINGDTYPDVIIGNNRGGLNMLKAKFIGKSNTYNPIQCSIFPNPSKNGIYNLTLQNYDPHFYQIFNSNGQAISDIKTCNKQDTFSISNQSNGLYFIKIWDHSGNFKTSKIQKLED